MKLFKVDGAVLLQTASALYRLDNQSWDALVNQENLYDFLASYASTHEPIESSVDEQKLEAPVGSQEILIRKYGSGGIHSGMFQSRS